MNNLLVAEFVKLLPVVVGAAAAILASCISSHLAHRLTEKREIAKTRREKIEALVKAVYSHDQFISEKQTLMVYRGLEHDAVNPLEEARMIQTLYFPELADLFSKVHADHIALQKLIHQQYLRNREREIQSVTKEVPESYRDAFLAAYRQYLADVIAFTVRARSLLDRQ
jgi:hypothetical protein